MCKKSKLETIRGRKIAIRIGLIAALAHFLTLTYLLNTTQSGEIFGVYIIFGIIDLPILYVVHLIDIILYNIDLKIYIKPVYLIAGTIWWCFVPLIIYKSYFFANNLCYKFKFNVKEGNINLKKWSIIILILLLTFISLL